ncbi:MAG: hypothetical protein U1C56_02270 [Candidatus Curtissbacteria bacterium]|nr:hypothetical protein [Candidatus Curtissbacteria bacterium]
MKKILILVFLLVPCRFAICGETIHTKEVESFFYADGKMERSEGNFEITYYLEGDSITRTRVFNLSKKEVIPDDTVYYRQSKLNSDPKSPLHLSTFDNAVIRAIGQPGTDAVEILSITDDFVLSCKSTNDYFVISRAKRIK